MNKSLYYPELIINLNTRLFVNSLAGISEQQAQERVSGHNNPLGWIAAHTVSARYLMLVFLGKPVNNPYGSLFDNFKAYDPAVKYPSLHEIKAEWDKVTGLVQDALSSVSEAHLAAEAPMKNPTGDFSNGGTLGFLLQHESYDIGQMAFLKKYHTVEAMSYS